MISALSVIHPEAQIGTNVIIEAFAFIDKDVIIGDHCWIGPNACLWAGTRLSSHCKVFSGAQISCVPQDMKYQGEEATAEIGENTTIREYVTISRGTNAKGTTLIKNDCLLMAYVHIAHDCTIGSESIISNNVQLAGHVSVGNFSVIGGMTAIRQFVNIGSHSMIAGGSLVRKDVPPYVLAAREPLSYIGINIIGLKRRGFDTNQINHIQAMYRLIYLSNLNTSQALERVIAEHEPSKIRQNVLTFITSSEKGIMKGRK